VAAAALLLPVAVGIALTIGQATQFTGLCATGDLGAIDSTADHLPWRLRSWPVRIAVSATTEFTPMTRHAPQHAAEASRVSRKQRSMTSEL